MSDGFTPVRVVIGLFFLARYTHMAFEPTLSAAVTSRCLKNCLRCTVRFGASLSYPRQTPSVSIPPPSPDFCAQQHRPRQAADDIPAGTHRRRGRRQGVLFSFSCPRPSSNPSGKYGLIGGLVASTAGEVGVGAGGGDRLASAVAAVGCSARSAEAPILGESSGESKMVKRCRRRSRVALRCAVP